MVADGHALPAGPADDDALQQRGAFAGRSGGPVPAVRGGVGCQPGAVGVVLVQGDVSGVDAGDEGDPFLAGQHGAGQLPAGQFDVAVPAEGERAGVAGVVQDPQHDVVGQRLPVDLALAGPGPVPPGERQARGVERLHARGRGPGRGEGGEQVRDGAPDGGVGVEDDVAGGVVGQPDGQRHDELAAAGLGDDPAAEPGPEEMELSLAELAFHPQLSDPSQLLRREWPGHVVDDASLTWRRGGRRAAGSIAGGVVAGVPAQRRTRLAVRGGQAGLGLGELAAQLRVSRAVRVATTLEAARRSRDGRCAAGAGWWPRSRSMRARRSGWR